jgi:ATP-binding cassette subfamily B protein
VLEHSWIRVVVAVSCLTGSTAVGWSLTLLGAEARITLAEKLAFRFERDVALTNATIPNLEHLEIPEYADQIQILTQNRSDFGSGLSGLLYSVDVFAAAVSTLIVAGLVDPILLLLTLTAVPALFGARMRYRWEAHGEQVSASYGRQVQHLTQVVSDPEFGMELRVFRQRARFRRLLRSTIQEWRGPLIVAAKRSAVASFVEEFLFVLVIAVVVAWLLYRAATGKASAATVVVAIIAARQIQAVVIDSISRAGGIATTLRTAKRLLWLRSYSSDVHRRYQGQKDAPDSLADGIRLDSVAYAYQGAGHPAVENFSLSLPAGAVVAIVGENGAGKTTLVKLLVGLYRPSDGTISIDGVDLRSIDIAQWQQRVSAAFQDFARYEFTVQHAVGAGHLDDLNSSDAVTQALDKAAASDIYTTLPRGVETQLGSTWHDGVDLSGGQWQKLALGRAMMRPRPLLLIFDEPTGALDAPTEYALFERYIRAARQEAAHGAITVIVTHRFSTAPSADLILVLDRGQIVEQGTHKDLIELRGTYAHLFELQARGYRS